MLYCGTGHFDFKVLKVEISGPSRRANSTRIGSSIGIHAHGHFPSFISTTISSIGEATLERVLISNVFSSRLEIQKPLSQYECAALRLGRPKTLAFHDGPPLPKQQSKATKTSF